MSLIEVKSSDKQFSPSLRYFSERLKPAEAIQLVHRLEKPMSHKFGSIQNAATWLAGLEC